MWAASLKHSTRALILNQCCVVWARCVVSWPYNADSCLIAVIWGCMGIWQPRLAGVMVPVAFNTFPLMWECEMGSYHWNKHAHTDTHTYTSLSHFHFPSLTWVIYNVRRNHFEQHHFTPQNIWYWANVKLYGFAPQLKTFLSRCPGLLKKTSGTISQYYIWEKHYHKYIYTFLHRRNDNSGRFQSSFFF